MKLKLNLENDLSLLATVLSGEGGDTTRPTVTITSASSGIVPGTFTCTFTFSEAVIGFDNTKITVVNGSAAAVGGTGPYTSVITPTATGTVTVTVADGAVADAAGNTNTASNTLSIIYVNSVLYLSADNVSGNDGDAIATWADQSGNGSDFTQGTADNKLILKKGANGINQHNVLRGTTNEFMSRADTNTLDLAGTGLTIFAVVKCVDATSNLILLRHHDEGSPYNGWGIKRFTNGRLQFWTNGKGAWTENNSTTVSDTLAHIVTIKDTAAGALAFFTDGTAETTATGCTIAAGTNNVYLASYDGTALYWKGDIALLIVCAEALADTPRQAIENYLIGYYDLPFDQWEVTTLPNIEGVGLYLASNPVIACGAGGASDNKIREIGNVLYEPSDTGKEYKIFYTGYNAGEGTDEKIHYAYSSDGITWTKHASNPIINDSRAEDPYVVKSGATYYLYAEDTQNDNSKVRCWTSADCVTWSDQGQINLTNCASPVVWIEGATWYMLYEHFPASPQVAYLATSADGLTWTDDAGNPAFSLSETTGAWATTSLVPDSIAKIGSTYYMTYHSAQGATWQSGIATSANLTTWTDSAYSPLPSRSYVNNQKQTLMVYHDGTRHVLMYYETDGGGVFRGYPIANRYI